MSEEELQAVWPSFLQEERNKKDDKDEGSEDEDDEDEDDGDEDGEDEEIKNEDVKDENTTSNHDKIENGNGENEARNGNAKQEAPAPKKCKRGPESSSSNGRVLGSIDDLLESCPPKKLRGLKATKQFLPELQHCVREHPEKFAAGHPGAVPLLLAALGQGRGCIQDLKLSRFKALSGDQVVELVEAVAARNANLIIGEDVPLKLLDLSFIDSVTPHHIERILDTTDIKIKELLIWDNAGLPLEEVAKVAGGRIGKVTTRAGFLAALEKWVRQCFPRAQPPIRIQPVPPTAPTQMPIRQVVWMMLVTEEPDASKPLTDRDRQLNVPVGTLSIENFDVETLATILHPRHPEEAYTEVTYYYTTTPTSKKG
ncbi:hypothetical protein F5883DRAFT_570966 [Diaporthe sp. PMI_573]|nr:hypothetical protein F5883DRAFT_570966 [Diaporthaceae sp. PMI_573]